MEYIYTVAHYIEALTEDYECAVRVLQCDLAKISRDPGCALEREVPRVVKYLSLF